MNIENNKIELKLLICLYLLTYKKLLFSFKDYTNGLMSTNNSISIYDNYIKFFIDFAKEFKAVRQDQEELFSITNEEIFIKEVQEYFKSLNYYEEFLLEEFQNNYEKNQPISQYKLKNIKYMPFIMSLYLKDRSLLKEIKLQITAPREWDGETEEFSFYIIFDLGILKNNQIVQIDSMSDEERSFINFIKKNNLNENHILILCTFKYLLDTFEGDKITNSQLSKYLKKEGFIQKSESSIKNLTSSIKDLCRLSPNNTGLTAVIHEISSRGINILAIKNPEEFKELINRLK